MVNETRQVRWRRIWVHAGWGGLVGALLGVLAGGLLALFWQPFGATGFGAFQFGLFFGAINFALPAAVVVSVIGGVSELLTESGLVRSAGDHAEPPSR